MKSILDDRFVYTPAASTDIGARFKRMERAYARMWNEAHAENAARDNPIIELPAGVPDLAARRAAK